MEMEDSNHLLSYKNLEQLKYCWVWKPLAVKASKDYKHEYRTLQLLRKNNNNNFIIFISSIST